MSKCRLILSVVGVLTLSFSQAFAQYQWTNLGDVFWVSGADVACGINYSSQTANRYLIAHDAGDTVYSWRPIDNAWNWPQNRPGANKVISYKVIDLNDYGQIAFCSAYEDRVYRTTNGGVEWLEVPNSQNLGNKHFTSIEVPNSGTVAGNVVMVACSAVEDQPSTYYTTDAGASWDAIGGSSSVGMQVNDLESYPEAATRPVMAIGTPAGIYQKAELGGAWDAPWEGPVAFGGTNVPVLESVDLQGDWDQIAAVEEGLEGRCNLYFNTSNDPWSSYTEIRPGNESFDRVVKDMAGIFWAVSANISCYVATPQGLFLVYLDGVNPPVATDIKELPNSSGYFPMRSDSNIVAVDYIREWIGDNQKATILAASPFNVYQITEIRDASGNLVEDIEVKDAVDGTYPAIAISPSLPINTTPGQKVFAITANGLVKERDLNKNWTLVAKAFTDDSPSRIGTDIATDFIGGTDFILASSNEGSNGTIMYSADAGATWTEASPDGDPTINTINLDPVSATSAYAAGSGTNVWASTNNGQSWPAPQSVPLSTNFTDIYADPDPDRDIYAYACGYYGISTPRMFLFDGSSWSSITNGLSGTRVNQIAKGGAINWLYAATDVGVF
jgi:photosystem II stability/assembly factor-like uncharacterized protein